jgi:hypothetical protein
MGVYEVAASAARLAYLPRVSRETAGRARHLVLLAKVFGWIVAGRQLLAVAATRARPYALATAGLSAFTRAAWEVSSVAGWLMLGLSCWALEWRIRG